MDKLHIVKLDWEERYGMRSIGGTAVRKLSSFCMGAMLTAFIYGILSLLRARLSGVTMLEMFFPGGTAGRTIIPLLTVFTAMWALSMLILKRSKLKIQRLALKNLPFDCAGKDLAGELEKRFDEPEDFIAAAAMLNRVELKNKTFSAVEINTLMESTLDEQEKRCENSFIPINCFIWSTPVLGFIGTVLGLAKAVSNFGALSAAGDKLNFDQVLPQVTGGLATAFETTLIALVLALVLQIISSFQLQNELDFLADVRSSVLFENNVSADNTADQAADPVECCDK